MTRTDLLAYLVARYGRLLAEAEIGMTDTVAALKEPLDDALRAMGYAESDLITAAPTDTWGALAQARYRVLVRIQEAIADRFDLTDEGLSVRLQQVVNNVDGLLAEARAEVLAHFGSLHGEGVRSGIIRLDFLSPAEVT